MTRLVALSIFTMSFVVTTAQSLRPEPGEWFLISPGTLIDEHVEVVSTQDGLALRALPVGKTPVSWGSIMVAADGTIEFRRAGQPQQVCTLKRTEFDTYVGSCRGSGSVTLAKNGNPGGLEIRPGEQDLKILARAREILSGADVWNRQDDRVCVDSRSKRSWSIYCALDQAQIEIARVNLPMRPVMEEVRVSVTEVAHRMFQRGILDFNNSQTTTYPDVVKAFDIAEHRLLTMRACTASPDPTGFPSAPADRIVAKPAYWTEKLGHTEAGHLYELSNGLGPMDESNEVPNGWATASASTTRRKLPEDARHALDVKGTLANGNQWRWANLCGERLFYHDVPPRTASFFDHLIDGVYWGSKPIS